MPPTISSKREEWQTDLVDGRVIDQCGLVPYVRHIPPYFGVDPYRLDVIARKPPVLFKDQIGRVIRTRFWIGIKGDLQVCCEDTPGEELLKTQDPDLFSRDAVLGSGKKLANSAPIVPLVHKGYRIYGHWLIDILPRVSFFRELYPGKEFCILVADDVADWVEKILSDLCGDAASVIKVRKETLYEGHLFLCTPFRYHDHISRRSVVVKEMARRFNRLDDIVADKRKLYVSRQRFARGKRSLINGYEIELFFGKNGFELIAPETLSFREQVELFASSSVIVGEAGSGMHNSLFAPPGTLIINLQSSRQSHFIQAGLDFWGGRPLVNIFGRAETDDWMSCFYVDLSDVANCLSRFLPSTFVSFANSAMSTLANNAGARAVNEDNKQPNSNPNLHWSVRRLNLIAKALNSRRYLEIGIHRGLTFRSVAIPERVGVDPHFDFEVSEIVDQGTSLFKATSDSYFASLAADQVFDLIFIDGLHTFEQTYRDLCGCLLHSHARTVFLIDDTKPDDVYSSMRNHSRAVKYRRASGGQGNSWHGDTFKVVFAIHDFHFGLNYRTISGSGNSQTVVWRSIAGPREPRLNSMETISRLDYFDLMDEIDVLRECSEQEAIELCLAELGMQDHKA